MPIKPHNPQQLPVDDRPDLPTVAVSGTALRLLRLMVYLVQGYELSLANALDSGLTTTSGQLIKDLHALRALGLPVNRPYSLAHHSYQLHHALLPITWSPQALSAWQQGLQVSCPQSGQPLPVAVQTARSVIMQRVRWASVAAQHHHLPDESSNNNKQQPLDTVTTIPEQSPSLPQEPALFHSVDVWQQWCQQGQQVRIIIACPVTGCPERCLLEPHQLLSEPLVNGEGGRPVVTQTLVLGYDVDQQESRLVALHTLTHAEQLPTRNRHDITIQRVMFRLLGRLAFTYRAYSGEQVTRDANKPDSLIVTAWVPHVARLLNRLMRYGANCQVVSPQSARTLMQQRIAQQLALL